MKGTFKSGFRAFFSLRLLVSALVPAVTTLSLIACGSEVKVDSKIDDFRSKASFVRPESEWDSLSRSKFSVVLFGNNIRPYINTNNFFYLSGREGKDFADYLEDYFKLVAPERLESFNKDLTGGDIRSFIEELNKEPQANNLSEQVKNASTVIISLGLWDVFNVIFEQLKRYDYVKLIFDDNPTSLFRSKLNSLREKIASEIPMIRSEYQSLLKRAKSLNPKADIILLGSPFVQLSYLDSVITGILTKFFDITIPDGILNETLSLLNGEISNLAATEDVEFITFNSRNFFEIKEPLLDSTYSFFSIKLAMLAQERLAKTIFLKLSTPAKIFSRFNLLIPGANNAKTIEETKEFSRRSRELRADWLAWLSTKESEEDDLGSYYKSLYFSPQEEKIIIENIAHDESLAETKMAEDDYKDKLFYQSQLENLVTSIFDKQTASSFLENNKLFLDSVSTAIASFFANTFEGYKSALKWVDLVKVIEIFVNFYRGLIAKVDDNTKAKVIDLFKQLIVRLSVDLRADFTNLKLETFAKYKDLLNELLSILIDQHAILEETISRWLFINLKPGQILGLLEKIRFALSDEKDSKDAT